MFENKNIRIIGVPTDLGASRRGVDMGPSALRIAQIGPRIGALGYDIEDMGNVPVPVREAIRKPQPTGIRYLPEIVDTSLRTKEAVYNACKDGKIPLVLGGDHALAIGSIAGVTKFYGEQKKKIGVIWLDAHGDINTPETSASGNIHGMPLAHSLGIGHPDLLKISESVPMVDVSKAVLIGIRDLDPGEQKTIREMGVRAVIQEAIRIATNGTEGFHLSFDVDSMDPSVAGGVGTPVRGGFTYREGHLAMEILHDSKKMLSMDITEVNPVLDSMNQTADLAVEMALSAFGKNIL
jgi:arginase